MKIFDKRLKNGTRCYIIDKEGCVSKEALLAVNFGSADRDAKAGCAHFLEHKVFEQKQLNVFDEFGKHGANVNAFTNFSQTAYYFSCYKDFEENLRLLLEFTANPYFTDESIEREKGIIGEEIGMYEGDPWWQVYFNLLNALYSENPVRNNIAGSKEDISGMNRDVLQKAYDRFYCGENTVLTLCGDFGGDGLFDLCEDLSLMKRGEPNVREKIFEENIAEKIVRVNMEVSKPLFNLGFKENDFDTPGLKRLCSTRLLLDMICGNASELFERLYLRGDIDKSFSMEYLLGVDYGAAVFSGVTDRGQSVCEEILRETGRLKKEGIDENLLEISKNRLRGAFLTGTDNIHGVASAVADFAFKGIDFWDVYKEYSAVTADDIYKRLNIFDADNCALSLVEPILK
ncbi:MAG: insulinase family protein [Clostridiales bacterium]|nr:insulinase family protein [Clostridiales bacterium]